MGINPGINKCNKWIKKQRTRERKKQRHSVKIKKGFAFSSGLNIIGTFHSFSLHQKGRFRSYPFLFVLHQKSLRHSWSSLWTNFGHFWPQLTEGWALPVATIGPNLVNWSSMTSLIHVTDSNVSFQDVDIIYSYMHGLESLSNLREAALRHICKSVRYEFHAANDILYW